MGKTLNMQDMRYINLFSKITKVNTTDFFEYNGTLFFCVPQSQLSKALGDNAKNLRKIRETLGKKAKILPKPKTKQDIKKFIGKVVQPAETRDIEINNKEINVSATRPNKASIIGRDRKNLNQLKKVTSDFFEKDFNVV